MGSGHVVALAREDEIVVVATLGGCFVVAVRAGLAVVGVLDDGEHGRGTVGEVEVELLVALVEAPEVAGGCREHGRGRGLRELVCEGVLDCEGRAREWAVAKVMAAVAAVALTHLVEARRVVTG